MNLVRDRVTVRRKPTGWAAFRLGVQAPLRCLRTSQAIRLSDEVVVRRAGNAQLRTLLAERPELLRRAIARPEAQAAPEPVLFVSFGGVVRLSRSDKRLAEISKLRNAGATRSLAIQTAASAPDGKAVPDDLGVAIN